MNRQPAGHAQLRFVWLILAAVLGVLALGAFNGPSLRLAQAEEHETSGTWGIRTSYRNYVTNTFIANGQIVVDGGVVWLDGAGTGKGPFTWPVVSATYDPETGTGEVQFAGSVYTTGHHGILENRWSNPRLVIDGTAGTLYADLEFRPFEGTDPEPIPDLETEDDVAFASIDLSGVSWTPDGDGLITITNAPAVGVLAAMELIGWNLFYSGEVPNIALDPLSVTFLPEEPEPGPDVLAFTAQPSNAQVGASIGTPAVTVQDAEGETITDYTGDVTIALTGGTGGAVLTCTGGTTVAAVAGVAAFTGCSVNLAGTGYALQATSGELPPETSATFNVSALPATKLAFTTQPTGGAVGVTIGTPVVTVQNASNGTVTEYVGTVTIEILGGSVVGRTLDCSAGGVTRPAVAGVVVFDGCSISGGTSQGTQLRATANPTLTAVNSGAFAVTGTAPIDGLRWRIYEQAWTSTSLAPSREAGLPAILDGADGWVFPVEGDPVYDPATGKATVQFAGSAVIGNSAQGGYRIMIANPSVEVDEDGNGELLVDLSFRTDAIGPMSAPVRVVMVTFTQGAVTDTGSHTSWTVTPHFPLRTDLDPNPNGFRQFAQPFMDALAVSLRPHFWQTATNQPNKAPAPLTVSFAYTADNVPTSIGDVIPDPAAIDPTVAPVSTVLGDSGSITLVDDGETALVTATFDNGGEEGTGKVLLAKYAEGWTPDGLAVGAGGSVYDVHFAPTSTTNLTTATLTVVFAPGSFAPGDTLVAWDGESWLPIVSNNGSPATADELGGATIVFGPDSTPSLTELSGTPIGGTAPSAVQVQFDDTSVVAGEQVTARLVAKATDLSGVDITFSFDTSLLQVANVVIDEDWWTPGPCPEDCLVWVDSEAGTVRIATARLPNPGPVTGDEIAIATITFSAIAASEGTTVDIDSAIFVRVDSTEIPAVERIESNTLVIEAPQPGTVIISGVVRLQGRGANGHGGITVYFGAESTTTSPTGAFSLTVPEGSEGTPTAVYPGYLRAVGGAITANDDVVLQQVILLGGDTNGDGRIDIADLAMVVGNFEAPSSEWPTTNPDALDPPQAVTPDVTGNGVVNIFDLTITVGNFDTLAPIAWAVAIP